MAGFASRVLTIAAQLRGERVYRKRRRND